MREDHRDRVRRAACGVRNDKHTPHYALRTSTRSPASTSDLGIKAGQ